MGPGNSHYSVITWHVHTHRSCVILLIDNEQALEVSTQRLLLTNWLVMLYYHMYVIRAGNKSAPFMSPFFTDLLSFL